MADTVETTVTEAPATPVAPAASASPAAPVAPAAGIPKPAAPTPAKVEAPAKTEAKVEAKPEEKSDTAENEGYWPADWRKTVSKDDAKVLSRLERYASPEAAMQALIAAQNRIAAGELKPVIGKNATPEQIAEWREAHGIPTSPDKYDLGEDVKGIDKGALSKVLELAHATNQTPDQVKASITAIKQLAQTSAEQRHEADLAVQKASEDTLREEWGPEFRRNINLINSMLDGSANPDLKAKLLGGRLADGTPIGSSPDALKFLVGLALIQNPAGVVVPGSEADPLKGVGTEIEKIEKVMRENRAAYNKNEPMQARLRELYAARDKMKPR